MDPTDLRITVHRQGVYPNSHGTVIVEQISTHRVVRGDFGGGNGLSIVVRESLIRSLAETP